MRKLIFTLIAVFFYFHLIYSQNSWSIEYKKRNVFIENKGQFDEFQNDKVGKIYYAADFGQCRIFFGENGLTYSFLESKKIPREVREKFAASSSKAVVEDHKKWEKIVGKFHFKSDEVNMTFGNINNLELIGYNKTSDYHSYTFKNANGTYSNLTNIAGFEKLTYKNIYPNIDIEYTVHPQEGIKYAILLHPGANSNDIEMIYDREVRIVNGKIHINSDFGDIIDHEPLTFYEKQKNKIISSSFFQIGNTVKFKLENYNNKEEVIIDPWTQTPSFATNWDVVWECDKDAAGNVYILGGIMPLQVIKYNAVGAIQWTYNTPYDTSNVWLGTFAVDNLGNSYLTSGSTAQIQKINNAAALQWNNTSPGGSLTSLEFWTITFNCDQSKLVVGGTNGSLEATVFDINVTNGNVLNDAQFAQGNAFGIPPTIQEVRAISASPNGKYYFMTQDTVGAFSQNFNLCSGEPLIYKIDNSYDLGYKCENYRYDNSGICAIKANNSFYYTQNGSNVHKRNLQTGAILATATIPGGASTTSFGDYSVSNSGLDLDDCGNVYVGSSTGVVKYDANLNQLATYSTSFKVYDVHVSISGDIIACGGTGTSSSETRSGGIQSFAASACAPLATNCCDATICPVPSLCLNDAPVTLSAATAGGTWSGPGTSANGTFNPTIAGVGTHTITYTLACGFETTTIIVSPCQALNACLEANGSITVSNGVSPYTWAYYQNATSTPITNQTQCQSCGYTWNPGFPPLLPAQCLNGVTPVTSCNTPAQWVNFATGTNATAPAGVTQVQVTDNSSTVTLFTISNLASCNTTPCPTINVNATNQTNVSCFGGSNGSVTMSATGGSAPYSYSWSPGNLSGVTQTSLTAGTYTVTATDNANCIGSTTVTISQPTVLSGASSGISPANCGSNNGSATVTGSGGTAPYIYSWSPGGSTGGTVSNLAGGNYVVTITDANSCTQTVNLNIPNNGGPTITIGTVTNPNCSNPNSGSVVVTGSGGTPGYNVSWSGVLNGDPSGIEISSTGGSYTISGLQAGDYIITLLDANNCSNSSSVTLTAPTTFELSEGPIVPADCGVSNGSAIVNVTGGSGNFSYNWSPLGGSSATANALDAGAYSVTVTDSQSGCIETLNITIPSVGGPSILNSTPINPLCNGASTGSILVLATGGTSPYQYSINSGTNQTNNLFSNLPAGNYNIVVTDANNCITTASLTLTEPTQLVVSASPSDSICLGQNISISATTSGGVSPYSYVWNNNQTLQSQSVNPTSTTTFNVTVADANGCTAVSSTTITVLPLPVANGSPASSTGNFPYSVTFTNISSDANAYSWDFGNGQNQNTTSTSSVSSTYNLPGTFEVILTASNGYCVDTWVGEVIVLPIGALDVEIPNVFSPNGDNINETYGIISQNASSQEAIIVNRWGALMAELNSPNAKWDGKMNGKDAIEGVYFIKYRIIGLDGIEKEGQQFFHLLR
jgi:gliding motility-associated-like protein